MNNIHLTEEEIAQYADEIAFDKSSRLSGELKQHVKECDICAEEILSTTNVIRAENIENIEIKAEVNNNESGGNKKRIIVWLAIAASIAFIVTLGILFSNYGNSHIESRMAIDSTNINTDAIVEQHNKQPEKDTLKLKEEQQIIEKYAPKADENIEALAFVSNKELEKLSHRYTDNLRSNEVVVITSNTINYNTGDSINLEWENNDKHELLIEIYNNNGEMIFNETCNNNSLTINTSNKVGLYYWKLINEDFDLIYCGKIIIK